MSLYRDVRVRYRISDMPGAEVTLLRSPGLRAVASLQEARPEAFGWSLGWAHTTCSPKDRAEGSRTENCPPAEAPTSGYVQEEGRTRLALLVRGAPVTMAACSFLSQDPESRSENGTATAAAAEGPWRGEGLGN